MDQPQAIINKIQYVQNRALRICLWKPKCYRVQKLHEEANMQMIKERLKNFRLNYPMGILVGQLNTKNSL